MDVREALTIGELASSTILAGHQGTGRRITSIEVMEVPEVVSWVTPGILVMTTFYSIREDERKQVEIVRTLIEKEAAGIVIKLGRFVESVPVEMIAVANRHDFPIIVIPKTVSYINVLTPLYERLYEEKQDAGKEVHPFASFESKTYGSLDEALDEVREIVGGPLYIEDMQGALLYASDGFLADGWRKSDRLFSRPHHESYTELLDGWKRELVQADSARLRIPGFRDALILPLVSNQQVIAVVHVPYTAHLQSFHVSPAQLKALLAKLMELFMNEQLHLQKQRIEDLERLEAFASGGQEENPFFLVRFQGEWTEKLVSAVPALIDPSCQVLQELHRLLDGVAESRAIVFEKYYHFYAVVPCMPAGYPTSLSRLKRRAEERDDGLFIAAGPLQESGRLLEEAIRQADQTLAIGRKLRSGERFYTYDQLGIYEILIGMTGVPHVRSYTDTLLRPLLEQRDLLHTLKLYLGENGNVTKTSEKLFIHRRTLTYRLQKIQELLHVDLDDAETRFMLQFCLKIRQLS